MTALIVRPINAKDKYNMNKRKYKSFFLVPNELWSAERLTRKIVQRGAPVCFSRNARKIVQRRAPNYFCDYVAKN